MKYDLDDDTKAVLAAVIAGEDVLCEFESMNEWTESNIPFAHAHNGNKLRLKPRTIRIGEYDVPEPMRVAPATSVTYFLPNIREPELVQDPVWDNDDYDKKWLAAGQCHYTKEDAIIHGKALRSLTEVKP